MNRSKAREVAMQLLYQYSITGELTPVENSIDILEIDEITPQNEEYFKNVFKEFEEVKGDIDEIISLNSRTWKFDRIAKVDLAILRLALFEMIYIDSIPKKVSLNEAIELAKKFSTEKSYKYVNGLLGGYLKNDDNQR